MYSNKFIKIIATCLTITLPTVATAQEANTKTGAYSSKIELRTDKDDQATTMQSLYLVCADIGKDPQSELCETFKLKHENGRLPSFIPNKDVLITKEYLVTRFRQDFADYADNAFSNDSELSNISDQIYKLFYAGQDAVVTDNEESFNRVIQFFEHIVEHMANKNVTVYSYAEDRRNKSTLSIKCADEACTILTPVLYGKFGEKELKQISIADFKGFRIPTYPRYRGAKALFKAAKSMFKDTVPAVTLSYWGDVGRQRLSYRAYHHHPDNNGLGTGALGGDIAAGLTFGYTESYGVVIFALGVTGGALGVAGAFTEVVEGITGTATRGITNSILKKKSIELETRGSKIKLSHRNFQRLVRALDK